MRKSFFAGLLALALLAGASRVSAQSANGSSYTNAIGLGIDFGNGATLVGPSFKHFFTENHAGVGEVLFGDNIVAVQFAYQYHKEIEGATGLRWFAGGGLGFLFGNDATIFKVSPMGGLDYKVSGAPLSFSFDWRPGIFIGEGDSDFEAGRFGLGFRYTFN